MNSPKPARFPIVTEHIPNQLKSVPRWVLWRWEWRKDKWTKPPFQPNGHYAKSTVAETWTSFDQAMAAMGSGSFDGVGITLNGTDDLTGVDLDDCVDNTGTIQAWALDIIRQLNSYSEITPSKRGCRVFLRGTPPANGCKKGSVEIYNQGRYLTVTGQHIPDTPHSIESRQDEISAVHTRVFGANDATLPTTSSESCNWSDAELLKRARAAKNGNKFDRLFKGQFDGDYPSPSEADQALCFHLAYWTRKDAARMDALFRQSGLFRSKWDTPHYAGGVTYGARTIEQAIAKTQNVYNGGSNHHRDQQKQLREDLLRGVRLMLERGDSEDQIIEQLSGCGVSEEKTATIVREAKQAQATQQLSEEHESKPQSISWPNPPDEAAFHGLAGDVVRLITPHSEADRVALLVQFLAAFGNIIGRMPHFVAEAAYHALNLFLVLVGVTSKARKGSSWAQIMRPYSAVEEVWARDRLQSGLSSGEGLIWAVRDPITKMEPVKEKGKRTGEYEEVIVDAGVDDKRLLVQEAEFSSPLRMCERDGNTLSALIRQAWETGNLRALTKNSPAKSTGAHISIVGHITRDELRRYLNTTEAGNGFGNRFLWFCARRSKCLPEGGNLEQEALAPLILRLKEAINFAKTVGEMKRDEESKAMWRDVYPELSEGAPGLLGAVTARAEAQVMRLACLYALLDMSSVIRKDHLAAALGLWEYSEASARYIFGDALGDPTADELLKVLRTNSEGLTRTDIRDFFGRNKRSYEIDRALGVLLEHGLASPSRESSNGRPVERWKAVRGGTT